MVVRPPMNPQTVEVLLDTTWRIVGAEAARTDALDRKAATLATFASLLTSLTATLGLRFLDANDAWWAIVVFSAGLAMLVASASFAVLTLLPREYVTLGIGYLRRFPSWSEGRKSPEEVRGETMRTLIEALARERETNERKVRLLAAGYWCLLAGLVLIASEAVTLAGGKGL